MCGISLKQLKATVLAPDCAELAETASRDLRFFRLLRSLLGTTAHLQHFLNATTLLSARKRSYAPRDSPKGNNRSDPRHSSERFDPPATQNTHLRIIPLIAQRAPIVSPFGCGELTP